MAPADTPPGGYPDDLGRLARIEAQLQLLTDNTERLLQIWEDHAHIVLAFRRGGIMAARTAARRAAGPGG